MICSEQNGMVQQLKNFNKISINKMGLLFKGGFYEEYVEFDPNSRVQDLSKFG